MIIIICDSIAIGTSSSLLNFLLFKYVNTQFHTNIDNL